MTNRPVPRTKILDIHPYVPGESKGGAEETIKLASNESPLGPSPRVKAAIEQELANLHRYPDGASHALRLEIEKAYRLDHKRVVCGNGSEQLIGYLAQVYAGPGDEVVQSQHGFLAYKIATLAAGADIVSAPEKNYTTDVDAILQAVSEKTRMVYLANPNNPTGTYIPAEEVARLRRELPAPVLLVLDAAYAEYVERDDYEAGVDLVNAAIETGAENVCMLRTFSKIYGLAALRLGWCYGPESVIDALNRVRGAFNLSRLSQAAGIAALRDQKFVQQARKLNNSELPRVTKALEKLGLSVLPSIGNFVLARFPGGHRQAFEVFSKLKKRGIILRPVAGYGLHEFLRITIGTARENDVMLGAMTEVLKEVKAHAD